MGTHTIMGPSGGTFSAPMMCTCEKKDQTAQPASLRRTRCKALLLSAIVAVVDVEVKEARWELELGRRHASGSYYAVQPTDRCCFW